MGKDRHGEVIRRAARGWRNESGVHGECERRAWRELLVEVAEKAGAVVEADAGSEIAARSSREERGSRTGVPAAAEGEVAERDRVPVAADQFEVECEGAGVVRGQPRCVETHGPAQVGTG